MTMWLLSCVCCYQALERNSTWRELFRRDFAPVDRQMERWAAELAENAIAEAGSTSRGGRKRGRGGASAVDGVATAAAAASPSVASASGVVKQLGQSPLALPAPRSLPAASRRSGCESEWKQLYASL
jgi:hypothetical protein